MGGGVGVTGKGTKVGGDDGSGCVGPGGGVGGVTDGVRVTGGSVGPVGSRGGGVGRSPGKGGIVRGGRS